MLFNAIQNVSYRQFQGALFSEMWKELKFAMRCMTPSTRTKSSASPEPLDLSPVVDGEVAAGLAAAAISLVPKPLHAMHVVSEVPECQHRLCVPQFEELMIDNRNDNEEHFSSLSPSMSSRATDQASTNEGYLPEGVGEGLSALSAHSIPWGMEQKSWGNAGYFQKQPKADGNSSRGNKFNHMRD